MQIWFQSLLKPEDHLWLSTNPEAVDLGSQLHFQTIHCSTQQYHHEKTELNESTVSRMLENLILLCSIYCGGAVLLAISSIDSDLSTKTASSKLPKESKALQRLDPGPLPTSRIFFNLKSGILAESSLKILQRIE